MKAVFLFVLFAFLTISSIAQISESEVRDIDFPEASIVEDSAQFSSQFSEESKSNKVKFGMTFGTYFSTNFGGGYQYGTYLSPKVTYPVSKRFSLSFGARINNSMGNSFYQPYYDPMAYPRSTYNPTQSLLYVEGAYRLSENLTLRGAAYKEVNLFSNPNPANGNFNQDNSGFIMGVDYKLGKNVFIQGQIEISNGRGYNPYNSFYGNPGFPNANSPFGNGYGFGQ